FQTLLSGNIEELLPFLHFYWQTKNWSEGTTKRDTIPFYIGPTAIFFPHVESLMELFRSKPLKNEIPCTGMLILLSTIKVFLPVVNCFVLQAIGTIRSR